MYEAKEHWNQYKQEQDQIKEVIKVENDKEFDEWMSKLIAKNGTTNY
jgi:hypothetical protein